jgi:16S rRNA C1402 N4-methylase RsmH
VSPSVCGKRRRHLPPPPLTDTTDPNYHRPVLALTVVGLLVTDPDGLYVDCTVGGGGHSRLILERLSAKGRLIGIDRDSDAIAEARAILPAGTALLRD